MIQGTYVKEAGQEDTLHPDYLQVLEDAATDYKIWSDLGDPDEDNEAIENGTITYIGGAGSTGTPPSPKTADIGDKIKLAGKASLSKEGFRFIGWLDGDDPIGLPGEKYTITGNTTLTAAWEEEE
jgi:hypothetical protein